MKQLVFFLLLAGCISPVTYKTPTLEKKYVYMAIKASSYKGTTKFFLIESYGGGYFPRRMFKETLEIQSEVFEKIKALEKSGIVIYLNTPSTITIHFYDCEKAPEKYKRFCF